jgi:hypothetical protein
MTSPNDNDQSTEQLNKNTCASVVPMAVARGQHYSSIHDVAWRDDGTVLLVASNDGFCTALRLDASLTGQRLAPADVDPRVAVPAANASVVRLFSLSLSRSLSLSLSLSLSRLVL